MRHKFVSAIFLVLAVAGIIIGTCFSYAIARSPSTPGAYVYIISPENGALVTSPVVVKFGLRGMGVAPAGVKTKNTGHHHLLIDVKDLPNIDKPIPADEQHMHFGKGQTEAVIKLKSGEHTLRLLFADFVHIPHEPVIKSEPITIYVVE